MHVILIAFTMLFVLSGMPLSVQAQWPLGKELTQMAEKGPVGPNITATGRFQIFVSPHIKGNTFMIDTDSGKIWIIMKDHAAGTFSLKRVPVEEVDGKGSHKRSESGTSPAGASQERK